MEKCASRTSRIADVAKPKYQRTTCHDLSYVEFQVRVARRSDAKAKPLAVARQPALSV